MSFIDARGLPENSRIKADLIIIGGGMAGITIAREWAGSGRKVAVLESGDRELDEQVQDLSRGSGALRAPGYPDRPIDDYLHQSRRRGLGGTAAIWGAKCVPLDAADFAKRDWLDRTGWPMTRTDLDPFYDRACALLEIEPFHRDYDANPEERRPPLRIGDGSNYFSAPRRFSPINGRNTQAFDSFRTAFAEAANIDVYLNANVTELHLGRRRRDVASLDVTCLNGRRHRAEARAYVLAAGGIENARLMLASRSRARDGVGNGNGMVGRCFAGHVTFGVLDLTLLDPAAPGKQDPAGIITSLDIIARYPMPLYNAFEFTGSHCSLAASLDGQRRARAANFTTTLSGPIPRGRDDEKAILDIVGRLDGGTDAEPALSYMCYFMSEQLPNLDSRVTLDERNVDALGMPRVRLDWSFTKEDFDRLEASIAALAAALGADGKGRLCWPVARERLLSIMDPARHHIGTTRMSVDPGQGVVDADCRVHGLSNLYIAGSSVFPTAGIANPTLTIIALAMRLSDHLKRGPGST